MHIDAAIRSRKSVRRFLPLSVPRHVIKHILDLAARAPSGNNVQPWHVHVVSGQAKQALCADLLVAATTQAEQHNAEYPYYPDNWFEPYQGRRRAVGFDLYEALGIERDDTLARHQQMLRNYQFFDAPVGLLISLDRRLNTGSFMDLGMFIQNIMLAARGQGLHTCAQAAFAWYHQVIRQHLPVADNDILVCGIALGHEDCNAPENNLETPREPVAGFASFHGFDEPVHPTPANA
ncbi:nitroreductase [Pseudomonas fluorescens]|uniref:Nitrobenzene nitroreductase n=1 Tax=Pseudomonas fluorescens TaxID=294 RepID=A0A5E7FX53_PSEFL|nr:nitroreductase [Pseudomonas fluorescens]VVO43334.1 Nitrobenzene nitroreductase [Pseudomonas fluorescens]